MLYKLKLLFFKNKTLKNIYSYIFRKKNKEERDFREVLIARHVINKTFIDVGSMWGVNGYFAFLAEKLGARSAIAFDIYPATEEFENIKKSLNSSVKFVHGDINSKDSINQLGKFDLVYCTGLLYHVPDPLYTLSRLREICNDVLIIGTAVIPEVNGIDNAAVFYPYLDRTQRSIWDLKQGGQIGITEPFNPSQGYGNWIWGFSNSCLISMLKVSGFEIVEKCLGRFYSYVVCKLSKENFISVSGDWTEPEYLDSVSKYKF